ncbi:MAG TPA: pyruvate carboxyltransferase, partial [Roseiflexaceae bacterium]|nr:pyruvate carboxyltransferase [Roseiflexaceae bacterium]
GVHADTTDRAYRLALAEGSYGQAAVDVGNSAYSGALPPYDMPLRTPALACFGCGKANVRYWREHAGLRPRPPHDIRAHALDLQGVELDGNVALDDCGVLEELVAQAIRCASIKYNGLTHGEAMDIMRLFFC